MKALPSTLFLRLTVLAAGLLSISPGKSSAQSPPAIEPPPPVIRLWLSAGAGPASFHPTSGASLRASASLGVERVVLVVRTSANFEGIDGHVSIVETSVLGGFRFGGKYLYAVPALGIANARWLDDHCTAHFTCTPAEAAMYESKGPGLAYDFGLHGSALIAGLAFNVAGVIAPPKRNLLALVISLEVGWFGK